jgi:hypothetical protein
VRRSIIATTTHDLATQDHQQGAHQDPNKNRTGHKAKHGRGDYYNDI